MSDAHHMISSGIPPLDARLGGAITGRIHLLSGGPGTGKSTAGLQFIRQGLQLGETVAMLTSDRLTDLRSHAAHLGIDLEAPLREGRLILLRYRPSFTTLLQHTASPEQMLDDLRRLVLPIRPARVLVDTVTPLVCSAPHADLTVTALAELLESLEATTLATYAGDMTAGRGVGYDHRLEPLVERAAAIFHLTRQLGDRDLPTVARGPVEPTYRFHVLRVRQPVRSSAPACYTIEAGVGLALLEAPRAGGRHRREELDVTAYEPVSRAGRQP
jgi:KaiC/GvpD/RAD55 family RecA-like ATPase